MGVTPAPLCSRVGRFRYVSGRGRLPLLCHLVLEIDPVPRRNTEQTSRAPDHVILELADLSVRVYKLPHHLDDAQPTILIDRTHDDAGEMIEIDRVAFGPRG